MYDKATLENSGILSSVADCYKNQEMFTESVDNYPHALEFLPECHKTQKMCNKGVNNHPSAIKYVPKCHRTKGMCINQFADDFFCI